MDIGAWLFFSVIVLGLLIAVKNKRLTILDMSILTSVFLSYYLLTKFLDFKMLSPFTFNGDELSISFIGVIVLLVTFLLIKYAINKFIESETD